VLAEETLEGTIGGWRESIVEVEGYPPRRQDTDTVQDTGSADEEV